MRQHLLAAASLALVTACGSTVPLTAPGGLPNDGVSAPAGVEGGPPPGGTSPTAAQPQTIGGVGAADGSSSADDAEQATAAGPGTVPGGSPVGGTLKIGTYYFDATSTNSLISSVGANSAVGDMRAEQRAVAAYLNSNGGVGGRRIEVVPHRVDIQGDPTQEANKLCSAWTEDAKVYAGIGSLPTTNPALVSCMVRNRTLAIGGSSSNVETSADFARWAPYYYAPAAVELVSAGRAYAEGLAAKRFFTPQAQVGIVYVEDPIHLAAHRQGLLPALERAGVTDPLEFGVTYDGSYAQYGNLVSQAQSAAFQFRARGITHVLFVDTGGALAFWFMQQAQSQGWNPRYGLSTLSAPSFLETNIDPSQLVGSQIVGWRPADDVTDPARFPANPARQLCQSIMRKAGLAPVSPFDLQIQLTTCSGFFLLKAALDRAASLDAVDVQAAVSALGTTNTPSASGFVDQYLPGKPWGGSVYATGSFVTGCGCFQYDRRTRRL